MSRKLGARPTPAELARRALLDLEDLLMELLGREWSGSQAIDAVRNARTALVEAIEPARWRREEPRNGLNGSGNGVQQ